MVDRDLLLGTWRKGNSQTTFGADGTWEEITLITPQSKRRYTVMRGRYWLEDDTLVLETNDARSVGCNEVGRKVFTESKPRIVSRIIALDENRLVFRGAIATSHNRSWSDDEVVEYVRGTIELRDGDTLT